MNVIVIIVSLSTLLEVFVDLVEIPLTVLRIKLVGDIMERSILYGLKHCSPKPLLAGNVALSLTQPFVQLTLTIFIELSKLASTTKLFRLSALLDWPKTLMRPEMRCFPHPQLYCPQNSQIIPCRHRSKPFGSKG
jgi:hypothetical protein